MIGMSRCRLKPVTWASTSNCSSTSVRAFTTTSFAFVRALGAIEAFLKSSECERCHDRNLRVPNARKALQPIGNSITHSAKSGWWTCPKDSRKRLFSEFIVELNFALSIALGLMP